ncbi:MAG TPA: bifunctional phosphopantothenoylcysteine decarboxylase/phosphopantothenate--cysteine ligase CoaBC [Deltaproteobacteria bacterium]|nr:bifunctional phosphopantothenoylcysteine decarboxylase/phosphopantothenate--cysteine ligase CoaBC [Deltaproteobacteria bacterium]
MLEGRHILLGVTGGIAAYKAVELVRLLKDQGAIVRVVMTRGARQFVTPLTFQAISGEKVLTDLFDPMSEQAIGHIELAKWADVLVIAPATANIIAKIAHGIADDYLTTVAVASKCKLIVCPAMNTNMYQNPITQANIDLIKKYGCKVVGPGIGSLACGDEGPGRLEDLDVIVETIVTALTPQTLFGKRVLVTAGPTWEAFDPVRFFTNPSSGKMGFAMAKIARRRGAEVTLVTGPTWLKIPHDIQCTKVKSAEEMYEAVTDIYSDVDIVVMAAAVSDYKPKEFAPYKIKKGNEDVILEMVKNPDILKQLGKNKEHQVLVGFAAETNELIENAREKLVSKNLDMIVANDVSAPQAGFRCDTNIVKILYKTGKIEELPCMPKEDLASLIWDRIENLT